MPRLASCRLTLHGVTGSPAGATRSRTLRSIATHTALRMADSILPLIRQSSHGSSGSRANLAMCRSKLAGDVARDPPPGSRYRGNEIEVTGMGRWRPGEIDRWIIVVLFADNVGSLMSTLNVPNNVTQSLQSVALSATVAKR